MNFTLLLLLGHDDRGYKVNRKRVLEFHLYNPLRHLPWRLKTWFDWRVYKVRSWKTVKCNLYLLLAPVAHQKFLYDPERDNQYYALWETPYGHLPYPLTWGSAWRRMKRNSAKIILADRWSTLTFPCAECGRPVKFKRSLCYECRQLYASD